MVNFIRNVFNSSDLPGHELIKPIKTYQQIFNKKIADSSPLGKICWAIANLVTGIFAYPTFGTLSLIGTAVSICGLPGLREHNHIQLINLRFFVHRFQSYGDAQKCDDEVGELTTLTERCLKNPSGTTLNYIFAPEVNKSTEKMQKIFFEVSQSPGDRERVAIISMKTRTPINV